MTGVSVWVAPMMVAGLTVAAAGMTGVVLAVLRRRRIFDLPNQRSSHVQPTPRGGGWAVLATLLPAWLVLAGLAGPDPAVWPILAGAAALMAISWYDDLHGSGPASRLLVQTAAVALGVAAALPEGPVFQGWLPPAVDRACAAVAWLWFVNLFNFMDGVDGITGTETACLGFGVAAVVAVAGLPDLWSWYGLAAGAAALGFLWWNWHPAKVFLGDVGSIPLGYCLGWLLLSLAAGGSWVSALLLPAYYLADATITLLRRLARGERIWQAHREHFYQQAVRGGWRHDQVSWAVLLCNLCLIGISLWSIDGGWPALPVGSAVVAALLWRFADRGQSGAFLLDRRSEID